MTQVLHQVWFSCTAVGCACSSLTPLSQG